MIPRFRAWDSVEKKFVEHFFITDNSLICNMEKPTSDRKFPIPIEKSELILMQSTGLKDKNGKEIFEGDVVRMRNPRDIRQIGMFQVVRAANSPMLGLLDKKFTTEIFNLYEHMRNCYEVKGNIYENREILEDKE